MFLKNVKCKVTRLVIGATATVTAVLTSGITINGSGAIDVGDSVSAVSSANTTYVTNAFQLLEFLGAIVIFASGMYVLNKVFSFIPKAGGSK